MVSKQRRWQQRMCCSGRCERCGKKRERGGHFCISCLKKRSQRQRRYDSDWRRIRKRKRMRRKKLVPF